MNRNGSEFFNDFKKLKKIMERKSFISDLYCKIGLIDSNIPDFYESRCDFSSSSDVKNSILLAKVSWWEESNERMA